MFNEEQQKAIETIKGQLILVACPGSGKTTTLLGRIHEMFVCQTSRTFDFKDAEPILVQISRLNINPPSNIELDEILIQKKAKTIMSA